MSGDKFVNDVRASSADARYSNKPFRGTIAQAKRQAAKAPSFPPSPSLNVIWAAGAPNRARYELLVFLNVIEAAP